MQRSDDIFAPHGGRFKIRQLNGAAYAHAKGFIDSFERLNTPTVIPSLQGGLQVSRTLPLSEMYLIDNWNTNAIVALASERPVLGIYVGVPFVLHDYFLALLGNNNLFADLMPSGENDSVSQQVVISRYDLKRATSWNAYPHIPDDIEPINLRYVLPSDIYLTERSLLADHLYEIAIRFLFSHEIAHISSGHLEYLRMKTGKAIKAELRGVGDIRTGSIRQSEFQSIELEADAVAVIEGLKLIVGIPANDYFNALVKSTRIKVGGKELESCHQLRLYLFAIGALFLYFEKQRLSNENIFGKIIDSIIKPRHPHSYARIVYMTSVVAMELLTRNIEEKKEYAPALKYFEKDIRIAAKLLDLSDKKLHFYENNWEAIRRTALMNENMRKLMSDCRNVMADRYIIDDQWVSSSEYDDTMSSRLKLQNHFSEQIKRVGEFTSNGQHLDAQVILEQLLDEDISAEQTSFCYHMIGNCWKERDRTDKAFESYELALVHDSTNLSAHIGKALIHLAQGNSNEAAICGNIALKLDPKNELVLGFQAIAMRAAGELDQSIQLFTTAIGLNDQTESLFSGRAVTYHMMGEYEKEIEDLSRALELEPENSLTWYQVGRARSLYGDLERAIEDLNTAIELNDDWRSEFGDVEGLINLIESHLD